MAMLAEPRRRQKWTLNPRGKQWSEDSSKFGQKMLEKMGWSSGKGLGANEQGMTEHVRISLKNDNTGIGFKKDDMDKAWTENQDCFNDFLQELQKSQDPTIAPVETKSEPLSGKSLELKSQQSRARVHYKKFTRGKDVNKYSSKDLANIFGQKELNENGNIKQEEPSEEVDISDPIGTKINRGGVITINGGNMADYFTKKGHGFSKTLSSKRRRSTDSESEPEYAGFGFSSAQNNRESNDSGKDKETCSYAFENPCLRINSPQDNLKSSKKRKSDTFVSQELNLSGQAKKLKEDSTLEKNCDGFVNPGLNLDSQSEEACNGKEFEVCRAQFGLANCALDITDEIEENKKRVTFNDHVEYSTDSVKKKKGKATLDKFEVENKKHKRKRKHEEVVSSSVSAGFVNEALDVEEISEEVNDNEVNERKSRKSKKRRESRRSNLETIVETPEEDKESSKNRIEIEEAQTDETLHETSVPDEVVSKKEMKKKKKKKDKVKDVTLDIENGTVQEELKENGEKKEKARELEEAPTKKDKKKKKKSKHISEASTENEESLDIKTKEHKIEHTETAVIEAKEEIVQTKRKKDKSKKDESNSTEIIVEEEKEVSDKENANSEQDNTVKIKKSKKSKKQRKSIDQASVDDSVNNTEPVKEEIQETQIQSTPSKKHENGAFHVIRSPWNDKARMSKKLLKSLFHRNSVQNFPGSNIHDIKGYGADLE